MPVILQAAIAAPAPEPQTRMPRSASPRLDRLADLARLVRVVDPDLGGVGAEVDHLVARERLEDRLAQGDAAVVESDGDLHARPPPPEPASTAPSGPKLDTSPDHATRTRVGSGGAAIRAGAAFRADALRAAGQGRSS